MNTGPEILVGGRFTLPNLFECSGCADYYHRGIGRSQLSPFGKMLRDLMLSGF